MPFKNALMHLRFLDQFKSLLRFFMTKIAKFLGKNRKVNESAISKTVFTHFWGRHLHTLAAIYGRKENFKSLHEI
jgi:hypothetical protein